MKILFICLFVFLSTLAAKAQNEPIDSIPAAADESYESHETEDYTADPDTTRVDVRAFSDQKLKQLKNDPELQFKEAPTVAESFFDRFLAWIQQFITSLFNSAVSTNWGNVIAYIIGIVILVVIIMMILRVNAFKVFYSGEGASTVRYNIVDENIHAIDFDREIQEAIRQNDYRRGVRLIFLFALKILSDKQLIHWEQGKTNHEYVAELSVTDLQKGLNELSLYFDYAWYGNFSVTREVFGKVQEIFNDWREKVK